VTLLVISPDYASHLLPLVTLATAWREAGERVVVASGPATAGIVAEFGFERVHLQLGRGSNAGVIRAEDQVEEEADSLRGFFDATRRGMVETLAYQARERLVDLMWEPERAGRDVLRIVDEVAPDSILIDHLAFSARLALSVAGHPYGDVVLGHPSALPVGDERYGFPPAWPAAFDPDAGELAALRALCNEVSANFTAAWNRTARALDGAAAESTDAFAEHGPLVLYNYPGELVADPSVLPPHVFLGSTRRAEPADAEVDAWIARTSSFAYVSFGSFLSVRGDVLRRVVAALAAAGIPAAVATGSTPRDELGAIPDGWLVREYLPQVRLLGSASVAVTHGGNNSVTEALGAGVPLLVLPFSTDQFAGAAAIEQAGVGLALAPNTATVEELQAAVLTLASASPDRDARLAAIAARQTAEPGPVLAFRALAARPSSTSAAMAAGSSDAAR
jgi:UDP:flavonoid glycosyltransferase YjiC (YdhE family)